MGHEVDGGSAGFRETRGPLLFGTPDMLGPGEGSHFVVIIDVASSDNTEF